MVLQGTRGARFHQYGPIALVGAVALVAIVVVALRHHAIAGIDLLYFAVLIPSIIIHEITHGVVANHFGDDTAKQAGRLSLNPLRHIDPYGTIILPLLLMFTVHAAFGWAKPVPVSVNRLRHPRNEAVLVSLAGPAVNIVLSAIGGALLYLLTKGGATISPFEPLSFVNQLLLVFGEANVVIAVFNLIPIPPLDGSAVFERMLPTSALPGYYRLRMFSMILVLFVVLFDQGLLSSLFNHAFLIWQHFWIPKAFTVGG